MIKKGSFPRRRLEKEEPSHMTNERRKEESMDNPAEYMLQFFNCEEREDGFDDNISKAFGQMHDTETCLNDLLSMNVRRLDTAKSVMPGIWEKLKSAAVKPFVAALLAEAAKQVASGTAQAFLQITS
jgi:hypothetical protein